MSNTNDFTPFATASGANVLSPATWAVDPAHAAGFQAGIAQSVKVNTAIRQAAFVSAMIAQFTADFGPGNVLDNGNLAAFEAQFESALNEYLGSFFIMFIPQTTYFVDRIIGSDTLYDGTTATISGSHGPWATIQHACTVLSTFNLGGKTVTIQLGSTGTYLEAPFILAPSSGTLIIRGNPASQSSYLIQGSPSTQQQGAVSVASGAVSLVGLSVKNTSSSDLSAAILASNGAQLTIQNVTMSCTTAATLSLLLAQQNGTVQMNAGCIFASSCINAIATAFNATITQSAAGATSGSPVFSQAFAFAQSLGVIVVAPGVSAWTGSGATGARYLATLNGVINSQGAGLSFFPGSTAGSTSVGGQSV